MKNTSRVVTSLAAVLLLASLVLQTSGQDVTVEIDGAQYYIYQISMPWLEAAAHCKERGMQLVSFETIQKWLRVHDYFSNEFPSYIDVVWTSGVFLRNSTWVWSALAEPVTFTAWDIGSPRQGNDCLQVHGLSHHRVDTWMTYPCDLAYAGVMCENTCPPSVCKPIN